MKKCTKCGLEKPLSDFGIRKNRSCTHNTACKLCRAIYQKKWYQKNKELHLARVKKSDSESLERNKKFINDIKIKYGCADCGIRDPIVLEFDHVLGEKEFNISEGMMQKYSLERIGKEILKCVVRCANCHRKWTFKRKNY